MFRRRSPSKHQLALYLLLLGALSCSDSGRQSESGLTSSPDGGAGEIPSTLAASTQSGAGAGSSSAGTESDPFQVSSCAGLQAIENDLGAYYLLTQHIDCAGFDASDGRGFRPIGDNPNPFTGSLDGDGHIVTGLAIDRPSDDWVGLFGVTRGAFVSRIGLEDVSIEGRQRVGGIAGWQREGVIEESFVTGAVTGEQYVGGITGRTQDGSISNSYAQVSLACTMWDSKANKTNAECGAIIGGVVQGVTYNSYGAGPMAAQHGATGGGGPETLIASFFDCDVSQGCDNTHAEGRPTATMQDPPFYESEGWDLESVWGFSAESTYPCLQWQPTCGGGPECSPDDRTCDGIDDDCDGEIDDDFPSAPTSCGLGGCVATGDTSCVDGEVVDSCTPGTPAADDATCDAIDDDCDGSADEDFASTPTTCGVGACAATGATTCVDGVIEDSCVAGTGALNDPTCDDGDDDCDGAIDEDYAPQSTTCGVGDCAATGVTSCLDGVEQDSCTPGAPAVEDVTCDGVDDNCDGTADEGFVSQRMSCGVGVCQVVGGTICVAGTVTDSCTPGAPAPDDTVCDGLDNDCDGTADEDYVATPTTCGIGLCSRVGSTVCLSGRVTVSCTPGEPTADDTCNGVDDDCDGLVDEAFLFRPNTCGIGVCQASGTEGCRDGSVVDSCVPRPPTSATDECNGLDDDCDGSVDEDFVPMTTTCGVGACTAIGITACVDGVVIGSCTPGLPTGADTDCNGIDDNCDASTDDGFVAICAGDRLTECVDGAVVEIDCDDGDACNGLESCADGACAPGIPPSVDDGNVCTTDSCDPALGVQNVPLPADTSCSDGDPCNGEETCAFVPAELLRNPSFEDIPRIVTGQGILPSEWGTFSGSPDTYSEDGSYGLPPTANGNFTGIVAHDGIRWVAGWSAASEAFFQELNAPLTPGETYRISGFFRPSTRIRGQGGYEIFLADAEQAAVRVSVGQFDPASPTEDGWQPRAFEFVAPANADVLPRLVFFPRPDPVTGAASYLGTDDVSLTLVGSDSIAVCQSGAPPVLSDGNLCTADRCDPDLGVVHEPLAAGTSCADPNFCDGDELCDGNGTCELGLPFDVDDGNPCTSDVCDAVIGVTHTPLSAGTPCGESGSCDAVGNCVGETNEPPVITSMAVPTALLDPTSGTARYAYDAVATDPEGDGIAWSLIEAPLGMTLGSGGELRWDVDATRVGSHAVRIRASDPFDNFADQAFTVTVTFGNRAPLIESTPVTTVTATNAYLYSVVTTDPDGDSPLLFSLDAAPAGMTIDAGGVVRWSPVEANVGSHMVIVRVADPSGAFVTQTYTITVVTSRRPPVFVTSPPITATVAVPYLYDADAVDPNPADTLTYSLAIAPAGMVIDGVTGLVAWTPTRAQLGLLHPVQIVVVDSTGLLTHQDFFVFVGGLNSPPTIVSNPVFETIPDVLYTYQPVAVDPDGDPITFFLAEGPAGMAVDPLTGLVTWVPTATDLGRHQVVVQVSGPLGDSTGQVYELRVAADVAPRFTTTPVVNAVQGESYIYDADAFDPNPADTIRFVLQEGPLGMALDPTSGVVGFSPSPSQVGEHAINIAAVDPGGFAAVQRFTLHVANVNDGPRITTSPLQRATVGGTYAYDVDAVDPDPTDVLVFSLLAAPPGMLIDPATGLIEWLPTASASETVEVRVSDSAGLFDTQSFVVEVGPDEQGPNVTLRADPERFASGESTLLTVEVIDEVSVASVELTVDGVPLALVNGTATYSSTVPGIHVARAVAQDPAGNLGTAELRLSVTDSGDVDAPVVELTSPIEDEVLTYLHDVVGTVTDANLLRYTLSLRATNQDSFVDFATGSVEVTDDVLANLDTTQLENGYYELRLLAEDVNGLLGSSSVRIRIDGGAKVGIVQLGFVDANLETLGIPLTVVRRYDSRDKREGDFGHGWRLDVSAGSIRHNRPVGDGVAIYTSSRPFSFPCQEQFEQKSHFTEVRLTDREYYLFRPIFANVQPISGACEAEVFFEFVDSSDGVADLVSFETDLVRATAVSPTNDERLLPPSVLTDVFTGELYDPQRFAMTTSDGRVFVLSVQNGIEQIQDPNGNAVAFQDGAIIHSDGRGLQFIRDASGRIERLIDPLGNEVTYEYDGEGDLVAVVDQLGGVTQYLYESEIAHHLTGIIDRQGDRVAAMDYTSDGRLRQLCDADGGCSRNDYDLQAREWDFFDATDRPIRRKYDDRGNVQEETDALNHTTRYFHDDKDRLISVIDPTGAQTGFGYDFSGNLTRRVEPYEDGDNPADFTTTFEYDEGDRLTRENLPTGGAYVWTYDQNGNQRTMEDADGNALLERTYGTRGEALTETDRFGTVTFTYDPDSQKPKTMQTPDGVVTTFTYDAADRLKTRTRGSVTMSHTYDAAGRPAFTDFDNGVTVDYEYGGENQWTAIEGPTFGRVERRVSAMGRLLGWTLPNGDAFSRIYDPQGRVRVEIDELGNETQYVYDVAGRLESVEDAAAGNTTTFARDAAGRASEITDGLGGTRSTTYYPDGRIKTLSQEVTERYFAAGGSACSAPPETSVRTTAFAYTPVSTTVTDPLTRDTVLLQNLYGLPSQTQFPGGTSTSSSFLGQTVRDEAQFFPTTRTDELLRDRTLSYSPMSALDAASDLSGTSWQYGYEVTQGGEVVFDVFSGDVSLGLREGREGLQSYRGSDEDRQAWPQHEDDGFEYRLRSTQSPEGETTTWHFSAQGRVRQIDYPFSQTETRTYDAAGQLDLVNRPDGVSLDHDFDVSGRELAMTATDGTGRAGTYGPGDRLDTMTDATGTTTFTYDAAGRPTGHQAPQGSLTQTRDALGRVISQETLAPVLTQPFPTEFAYDEEGRPLWLRDRRGKAAEMQYDAAGRLIRLNHGQTTCSGGSVGQSIGPTTSWTYDDRDRIETVVHRGPPPGIGQDGPVLLSRTYARNDAGEPTRIIKEDGTYTEVDYDPAGRVEAERYFDAVDTLLETITYAYDLDGNRTERASSLGTEDYVYDTGSRLTQVLLDGVETQRFEYDDNGRVSRIVRDGLDQRLTWDALDRLVRVEDQNFVEDPIDFTYDGQGRRISADRVGTATNRYVVGPTGNQSLESPHLVHNGTFLTGELVYNGEHALWRYDGNEPPDTRIYLRDAMGSVIGLMDEDGNLVESFEYDAFGNVRSPGGEALPEVNFGGDTRFQGMWKDSGTGLYYVRARYYDPRTGRFLSRDAAEGELEQPESFMPYAFANGNPYVWTDPTGRFSLRELEFVQLGRAALQNVARSAGRAFLRAVRAIRDVSLRVAGRPLPNLGSKLEFVFGNATGSAKNIKRSTDLARQLNRIGIFNNPSGRAHLVEHFGKVLRNPTNVAKIQKNGRVIRESLLAGRNGLLKVQSVWEGNKLITVFLFGG